MAIVTFYYDIKNETTYIQKNYSVVPDIKPIDIFGKSKEKYAFKFWSWDKEGLNIAPPGSELIIDESGNCLLFAQWDKIYTTYESSIKIIADKLRDVRGISYELEYPLDFIYEIDKLNQPKLFEPSIALQGFKDLVVSLNQDKNGYFPNKCKLYSNEEYIRDFDITDNHSQIIIDLSLELDIKQKNIVYIILSGDGFKDSDKSNDVVFGVDKGYVIVGENDYGLTAQLTLPHYEYEQQFGVLATEIENDKGYIISGEGDYGLTAQLTLPHYEYEKTHGKLATEIEELTGYVVSGKNAYGLTADLTLQHYEHPQTYGKIADEKEDSKL